MTAPYRPTPSRLSAYIVAGRGPAIHPSRRRRFMRVRKHRTSAYARNCGHRLNELKDRGKIDRSKACDAPLCGPTENTTNCVRRHGLRVCAHEVAQRMPMRGRPASGPPAPSGALRLRRKRRPGAPFDRLTPTPDTALFHGRVAVSLQTEVWQ
jgi:hypothetical protein